MNRRDFLTFVASLPIVGKLVKPAEASEPDLADSYARAIKNNHIFSMKTVKDGCFPKLWVTKNTGEKRYLEVGDMPWFDFLDKHSACSGIFTVVGDYEDSVSRTLVSHALATKMMRAGSKVILFDHQFPYQQYIPLVPVVTSSQTMSWMFTHPQDDPDRWRKSYEWFREMSTTAHQHECLYVVSLPLFKRPTPALWDVDDMFYGVSFASMMVSSLMLRVSYSKQYDEHTVKMVKNRWWPGPQRGDCQDFVAFGAGKRLEQVLWHAT